MPGIVVQNRQNYAQDLQISSRGFGARSTFGVRGVRLYTDGIPATCPTGRARSRTSTSVRPERIEVLRGPFSALYGNSSGGVMQLFTEDGAADAAARRERWPPAATALQRHERQARRRSGAVDCNRDAAHFRTDGYRDHSAARRDIDNAKVGIQLGDGSRLTLVANSVRLPDAQDPLGLTRAQVEPTRAGAAGRRRSTTRARRVDQTQAALIYEHGSTAPTSCG